MFYSIKKVLAFIWVSGFLVCSYSAQCDLSIVDVNLNTYDVTVAAEGEGCMVTMLQIGFHIPGN